MFYIKILILLALFSGGWYLSDKGTEPDYRGTMMPWIGVALFVGFTITAIVFFVLWICSFFFK